MYLGPPPFLYTALFAAFLAVLGLVTLVALLRVPSRPLRQRQRGIRMEVAGGVFALIGLLGFLASLPPPCAGFCSPNPNGGWLLLSLGSSIVGVGLVIIGFSLTLESYCRAAPWR